MNHEYSHHSKYFDIPDFSPYSDLTRKEFKRLLLKHGLEPSVSVSENRYTALYQELRAGNCKITVTPYGLFCHRYPCDIYVTHGEESDTEYLKRRSGRVTPTLSVNSRVSPDPEPPITTVLRGLKEFTKILVPETQIESIGSNMIFYPSDLGNLLMYEHTHVFHIPLTREQYSEHGYFTVISHHLKPRFYWDTEPW